MDLELILKANVGIGIKIFANFQAKRTILIFWPKFALKYILGVRNFEKLSLQNTMCANFQAQRTTFSFLVYMSRHLTKERSSNFISGELLMVCHHLGNFGQNRYCSNRYVINCHMIK